MSSFSIIFKIEKSNVKDNKSVSFNNEIRYFICIINCEIIIIIKECEILKKTMLMLILFKVLIVLLISFEFNIVFS